MKKSLPKILEVLGGFADEAGMKAWLVGGAVRDLMLKRAGHLDMDIVVEGNGIRFAERASKKLCCRLKAYPKFKTATVTYKGLRIDIASARSEKYTRPAALPIVKLAGIKEDMSRRDFTINAMAIGINKGNFGRLYDFYGGMKDLRAGRIRVLHKKSFIDDPTRILRAERFKKKLKFNIERHTQMLMREAAESGILKKVEKYRISKEKKKSRAVVGSRRL